MPPRRRTSTDEPTTSSSSSYDGVPTVLVRLDSEPQPEVEDTTVDLDVVEVPADEDED